MVKSSRYWPLPLLPGLRWLWVEEVLLDIEAGRFGPQTPIPIAVIMGAIDWLLRLPSSVDVPELTCGSDRPNW